jgi:hypothetical protein
MVDPALALAIDGCVNDSVSIVWRIGKKVKQVIEFKTRCLDLYDHAKLLRRLLERHQSEINNFETLGGFTKCLTDIEHFVDDCQKLRLLGGVVAEVLFKRRYQQLLKDLTAAKDIFALESFVSSDQDQLSQASHSNVGGYVERDFASRVCIWRGYKSASGYLFRFDQQHRKKRRRTPKDEYRIREAEKVPHDGYST